MASRIMQGDRELLKGDDASIAVIFANLQGENFDGREAEHQIYLNRMKSELQCDIDPAQLRLEAV